MSYQSDEDDEILVTIWQAASESEDEEEDKDEDEDRSTSMVENQYEANESENEELVQNNKHDYGWINGNFITVHGIYNVFSQWLHLCMSLYTCKFVCVCMLVRIRCILR